MSPAGDITIMKVCLKNAFCKMCVAICGRFRLNEGGVAGYVNRTKVKYAAKWGVQIAGMIFQTRSSCNMQKCPLRRMIRQRGQ